MSKIALTPSATGTGTFTISSPATNTNRTLTLPDEAGTVLTSASSLASANLTGALPAISGAALTDLPAGGGMTFLGALTTTSGSSVTLSGLTLTSYKVLQFFIDGISGTASDSTININSLVLAVSAQTDAANLASGGGFIDLTSGLFWCASICDRGAGAIGVFNRAGASGLTTSSTSITFTISGGTFDAGSMRFYGVA